MDGSVWKCQVTKNSGKVLFGVGVWECWILGKPVKYFLEWECLNLGKASKVLFGVGVRECRILRKAGKGDYKVLTIALTSKLLSRLQPRGIPAVCSPPTRFLNSV